MVRLLIGEPWQQVQENLKYFFNLKHEFLQETSLILEIVMRKKKGTLKLSTVRYSEIICTHIKHFYYCKCISNAFTIMHLPHQQILSPLYCSLYFFFHLRSEYISQFLFSTPFPVYFYQLQCAFLWCSWFGNIQMEKNRNCTHKRLCYLIRQMKKIKLLNKYMPLTTMLHYVIVGQLETRQLIYITY